MAHLMHGMLCAQVIVCWLTCDGDGHVHEVSTQGVRSNPHNRLARFLSSIQQAGPMMAISFHDWLVAVHAVVNGNLPRAWAGDIHHHFHGCRASA